MGSDCRLIGCCRTSKVEWHPGERYPRIDSIVTNLARPAVRVVAFYNQRGTAAQRIKEGKAAIKWTRLSCRTFAANAVATPAPVADRPVAGTRGARMSGAGVGWATTAKVCPDEAEQPVPAPRRR
jgi:DDE family transposase